MVPFLRASHKYLVNSLIISEYLLHSYKRRRQLQIPVCSITTVKLRKKCSWIEWLALAAIYTQDIMAISLLKLHNIGV